MLEIFELLKLDSENFGFIRTESTCVMFCSDAEFEMGIHPICSLLYAASIMKENFNAKQTDINLDKSKKCKLFSFFR